MYQYKTISVRKLQITNNGTKIKIPKVHLLRTNNTITNASNNITLLLYNISYTYYMHL